MDLLNEYVLNFVKDTVSKSHLLKEKFKVDILQDKLQRMKDVKETENKLEAKVQRLQKEIEHIEDNIADLQVASGLGQRDKRVADKVIERYFQQLETTRLSYQSVEQEIALLYKDMKWLDWIEKYSENLALNTSTDNKQQDFLNGVLNKIIIKSEYGLDRDGTKEIQKAHTIDFQFKLKIVDDFYYKLGSSEKSVKEYEVKSGKNIAQTDALRFTTKRNKLKK